MAKITGGGAWTKVEGAVGGDTTPKALVVMITLTDHIHLMTREMAILMLFSSGAAVAFMVSFL